MTQSLIARLSPEIKQYLVITGNYWSFTLTDGALRMLVVLYFHQLGYSPLAIASLFLFYEIFGVVTNLLGGWLGARLGLNKTMNIGLFLQIVAVSMLALDEQLLTIAYVMVAQALSGIAKDLNKMSAKSAIKLLVPKDQDSTLYKWVALLTGSKNALKGVGFFLGGILLTLLGFQGALWFMAAMLTITWLSSLVLLKQDLGKKKNKPKFNELFSKSRQLNLLAAARLFLFASRDVWFVVALPVFLASTFGWDHWWVGGFMASWVIAYGIVQANAPKITAKQGSNYQQALKWVAVLPVIPALLALGLWVDWQPKFVIIAGLLIFGAVFAVNSSLHSFLIVKIADSDGVSMDVGFYYMANAMGRLLGTVLSGLVYQFYGLEACLLISSAMLVLASLFTYGLSKRN
ncbi:organoarsenical effux MFS transporter ArsJ [Pseudoalteromonas luteoviolacea]|uniref:MFS transporter permease n=1 Tax=Pseudoalteromonas luteoviolacea S4054 TaxID=1129367 RepID=A0A0F6A6A3_9GAMM|nr:organoarsenical effux MFS transporter ArsJ [Pseudoalteromonas luteoviolacea]AOT08894.1 MFS transporter permease [Pseudoalteromonas luteoviolacea]AOT13807.1 MFS transporter permease [Pseudoalteromonas luteoviolacea]AOT18721.1 MFS transporter permease [Pseudoalteromonas luteoviolacea]KKE81747.1 MFS transporter permease [Pseudoalteromonas luteoviolacea S4054]KZN68019.1 MFS transporter permease [Pseudoalteromonas luteoviolacea S4047-1]